MKKVGLFELFLNRSSSSILRYRKLSFNILIKHGMAIFHKKIDAISESEDNCNRQGKGGNTCTRARTLPNPEALGPEIEEGAVN